MLDMGGYERGFAGRTYLEEHISPKQWFTSERLEHRMPEYKLWLPVKRVSAQSKKGSSLGPPHVPAYVKFNRKIALNFHNASWGYFYSIFYLL
ncbi:hypothetical protein D7X94_07470 [Acutalibacter sp. 1XD8-33]|nr:hypothetical protein D7X94_07470 [Acutalibacter sp. 1XD8-33]